MVAYNLPGFLLLVLGILVMVISHEPLKRLSNDDFLAIVVAVGTIGAASVLLHRLTRIRDRVMNAPVFVLAYRLNALGLAFAIFTLVASPREWRESLTFGVATLVVGGGLAWGIFTGRLREIGYEGRAWWKLLISNTLLGGLRGDPFAPKRPAMAEVMAADPRAPIVWLRSFRFDELDANQNASRTTFEEDLAASITKELGPFVAVGDPRDAVELKGRMPGATRAYVGDDWRARVAELVERAARILVVEGPSEGLGWELTHLRERVDPRRVLVLTVPRELKAAHRVWWAPFTASLAKAGIAIGGEDPGPGAILSFDDAWRPTVVARTLEHASDYLSFLRDAR
jgi:hypothetical protein